MELITGYTGVPHVTPEDDAIRNSFVLDINKRVVLSVHDKMAAEIINTNEIHILRGYAADQGKLFKVADAYEAVTIDNGEAGVKRSDIIAVHYIKANTGIESVSLEVIRGSSGDDYVDPPYTQGSIIGGALEDYFPLYRVRLDGVNIAGIDKMYEAAGTAMDMLHPIGSIYTSFNPTSPADLFGGTWVQLKGVTLVGVDDQDKDFNEAGKTGGEKTHVLSQNELAEHQHGYKPSGSISGGDHQHSISGVSVVSNGAHTHSVSGSTDYDGVHTHNSYVDKKFASGTQPAIRPNSVGGTSTMEYTISGGIHHHTITGATAASAGGHAHSLTGSVASASHTHAFTGAQANTEAAGANAGHNNMQPYITCYMWTRTA